MFPLPFIRSLSRISELVSSPNIITLLVDKGHPHSTVQCHKILTKKSLIFHFAPLLGQFSESDGINKKFIIAKLWRRAVATPFSGAYSSQWPPPGQSAWGRCQQ